MAHHCRALVLHCIDFRLQAALTDFLDRQALMGDADILSLAGGVRSLVMSNSPDATELFKNVTISYDLHAVRELWLINHTDCGAYGGRSAFSSDAGEWAHHEADLRQAARLIIQRLPDVTAKLFIAKLALSGTPPQVSVVPVANDESMPTPTSQTIAPKAHDQRCADCSCEDNDGASTCEASEACCGDCCADEDESDQ